jgi:hypothetical protein
MLKNIRIRLLSHFLGSRPSEGGCRVFNRLPSGAIGLDYAQWDWSIRNAAKDLFPEGIDLECIKPARGWSVKHDQITLYNRQYNKSGKQVMEVFEAIAPGQIISIDCHIAIQRDKSGARQPDITDVIAMLDFVGEYYGLSPWGAKFGYGRFETISNI